MLDFDDEVLPSKVMLGFLSFNVREYIPKPTGCHNCQRFVHIAKNCQGRRRCPRCGGDHEYGQCNHEQPKRCNCGGNHTVAYGGCEEMKRQVEIQQVRTQNKISYAEAVKMVKQRGGSDERRRVENQPTKHTD